MCRKSGAFLVDTRLRCTPAPSRAIGKNCDRFGPLQTYSHSHFHPLAAHRPQVRECKQRFGICGPPCIQTKKPTASVCESRWESEAPTAFSLRSNCGLLPLSGSLPASVVDTSLVTAVRCGRRPATTPFRCRPAWRLRLLPGRFMVIPRTMGIPTSRGEEAAAELARLVEKCKRSGFVHDALVRDGIQGASVRPLGHG